MNETFLFSVLPVDNSELPLVGRRDEIEKIKSSLTRFQNISIVGETKIGKSSILKTLDFDIKNESGFETFIPVYIDLDKFSFDLKTEKLLERILRSIYFSNKELKQEFSEYPYSKQDEFSEVVDSCNRQKLTILLLLDNFDSIVVLNNLTEDFFTFLRGNAIERGLSIVTASRNKLETLCHKGKIPGSQFWNVFNPIISLSLFEDSQEAKKMLSQGIKNEAIIDFIITKVGLHPCFLKIAGNAVIENKLTDDSDTNVIEDVIYESLKPYYEKCLKMLREDETNIVNGIPHKLEYISMLNVVCNSEIQSDLLNKREIANLKQLGYLQHCDERKLKVYSPLFAKFLKEQTNKILQVYSGDQPYVFISYARSDKEEVEKELQKIMNAGIKFWYDAGIAPASEWKNELISAISKSRLLMLFVSAKSIASDYVQKEINFAIGKKIPILQVYLEDIVLSDELIFIGLNNYQHVNRFDINPYEERLFKAIKTVLDS